VTTTDVDTDMETTSTSTTTPMPPTGVVVRRVADVREITAEYEVLEKIGTGGFATVARARERATGREVAIKVVDKSKYAPTDRSFEREVAVLSQIKHKNVVELLRTYVTERNVFMVCELASGGELLERVRRVGSFTEDQARRLIGQILEAVKHMHERDIVHRDLKLENILLSHDADDADVKLIDFGLARFKTEGQTLRTICGSPLYIAPEILELETSPNEDEFYTRACDMWSVGVILFVLLSGYSPFDDDDEAMLYQNIRHGIYHLEPGVWDFISNPAKSLVAGLLETDPNERLTAAQALEHVWIQGAEEAPSTTAPPENFDVQLADRLKTQMEFIRQVREEEMLAVKQAHRVHGTTTANTADEEIFSFPTSGA